uniref:Uncharacterized protein n=1 Tax=Aplanochytrium stocchinoi TaxID=215587 RepID=A0A7S3LL32_9STRA|mmetsp:Transcript_20354/g.24662  ORF Transcript_20354/g.24662 Transcript_20354/m.24662 type:complete len:302 (+) Transcript_20354:67-972(+)|eukprot:CAMPEP_0204834792 /NCGR_PEP_ID=MMETSP1346-20131115/20741_1 /ASSEMBLY_ACC=CAM_ASM_000771 /TAXON_ID=215587 /ORGANISM="Aplanochytrium stocchinoi, Strain GSBS06" /LENGTH=301 /DNA_ID=CAMNT_0051968299 /DNA_START=91 /DNA_END=996 /DNA_ORIENTATION=+
MVPSRAGSNGRSTGIGPPVPVPQKKKLAKPGEHLLNSQYCFWYMRRGGGERKPSGPTDYEKSIKQIGEFATVEGFWQLYNHLVRPNEVPHTTDYHLFKSGIKPIWEDPANKMGGKWIVRLRKGIASRYWEAALLAIIGEDIDVGNEICGAVISVRYSEDIIAVWNRNADNVEAVQKIRDALRKILRVPDFAKVEYKRHDTALQDSSSFRNTNVWRGGGGRENNSYSSRDRESHRDSGRGGRPSNLPAWASDDVSNRTGDRSKRDEREGMSMSSRNMSRDQGSGMRSTGIGSDSRENVGRRW